MGKVRKVAAVAALEALYITALLVFLLVRILLLSAVAARMWTVGSEVITEVTPRLQV
jgi:hypothetical protein